MFPRGIMVSIRPLLLIPIIGLVVLAFEPAFAEPKYPRLTGRIVDRAELLQSSTHRKLVQILRKHERETTNQVVVVTLKSLQGYSIEDFGLGLGNHWKIGQKGKDNGVLLIVAPKERKVRIEVGLGLEGILTNSLAQDIIDTRILSEFRENEMEAGIQNGVTAILEVLTGSYKPGGSSLFGLGNLWYWVMAPFCFIFRLFRRRRRGESLFSGGGGSFGGGGASGSW